MYKITLSNGTVVKNVTTNGSYFTTVANNLSEEKFAGGLTIVKIEGDGEYAEGYYYDCVLAEFRNEDDLATPEKWFILTLENYMSFEEYNANSVAKIKDAIMTKANNALTKIAGLLTSDYAQAEIDTFPKQEREAFAYNDLSDEDKAALTPEAILATYPLCSSIAAVRGLEFPELIGKVLAASAQLSVPSGLLLGAKQSISTLCDNSSTVEELTAVNVLEVFNGAFASIGIKFDEDFNLVV